eukprot:14638655-Alexandrium_andersonii.AAC.1
MQAWRHTRATAHAARIRMQMPACTRERKCAIMRMAQVPVRTHARAQATPCKETRTRTVFSLIERTC